MSYDLFVCESQVAVLRILEFKIISPRQICIMHSYD